MKKKTFIKTLIVIIILVAIAVAVYFLLIKKGDSSANEDMKMNTSLTEVAPFKGMIQNKISSSSPVKPANSYEVSSLETGTVIKCDVKEGEIVKKDQVLYTIENKDKKDKKINKKKRKARKPKKVRKPKKRRKPKKKNSSNDREIKNANKAIDDANKNYDKIKEQYKDLEVKSKVAGNIIEMSVKKGDKIGEGSIVCKLENRKVMKIEVPFLRDDVKKFKVGQRAKVILESSFEEIAGTVSHISNLEEVIDGTSITKAVTIEVDNPGGIIKGARAACYVGDAACSRAGEFDYKSSTQILSSASGEVISVNYEKGDFIEVGNVVVSISSKQLDEQLESAKEAIELAKENLQMIYTTRKEQEEFEREQEEIEREIEKEQEEIEREQEKEQEEIEREQREIEEEEEREAAEREAKEMEDYVIKSPIDGTIVEKIGKIGDNITSGSKIMIIYDMSYLTFTMNVLENDIKKVSVGQSVSIYGSGDEYYEGEVTRVGINGTTDNFTTKYPVTVVIKNADGLLPGMNVRADIITDVVENALVVPVSAVVRGGLVLVTESSPSAVNAVEGEMPPEGYVYVPVEIGISDKDNVQILSGLQESDTVAYQYIDNMDSGSMMDSGMKAEF